MRPTTCLALLALAPLVGAQYSTNPTTNLELSDGAGAEVQVKLARTTDGKTWVSWYDSDPSGSPAFGYDVKLQLLDASGNELLAPGGVLVADRGFSSTQDYGLAAAPNGDALLAFRDDRFSGTQITATRIDQSGAPTWAGGANGLQLTSTTDFVAAPKIAGLPNGLVVAWTQNGTVQVRRLGPGGTPLGPAVQLSGAANYSLADVRASDGTNFTVSWIQQAGGFFGPRHLYVQKFASSNAELWTPGGVPISTAFSLQLGNFPPHVPDGNGGVFLAWYTNGPLECWAQHVQANGTVAYPVNGAAVSTDATRVRVGPSLAVDPLAGLPYVFWTEQNALQSQSGLRVQRFDASGARLFGAEGLVLEPLGSSSVTSVRATAVPGGAFGSWLGGPGFGQDQVRSVTITDVGGVLLPASTLASTPSSKDDLAAVADPWNGLVCAWHGDESGDEGVHVQNLRPDLNLGPWPGAIARDPSGLNVASYTATVGPLGGTATLTLDLSLTGHPFGLVLGYTQPAFAPFAGGAVLVNVALPDLLLLAPQAGPLAQWTAPIPGVASLSGFVAYTQGAHFGGGLPLALTNANDVHLGL